MKIITLHKWIRFGVVLIFTQNVFASFTVSGTTITQSGIDADLSGLSGIAGITTQTFGEKNWYFVGDVKLNVSGTLSFDPRYEAIIFGDAAPYRTLEVLSGGTLNMGVPITLNGYTRYTEELGIYFGRVITTQGWDENLYAGLYIAAGGTFNWNGGKIDSALSTGFRPSATVQIRGGILDMTRSDAAANIQLRYRAEVDILGLTIYGEKTVWYGPNIINLSGYRPVQMIEPLVVNASGASLFYELRNYDGDGNTQDTTFLNSTMRAIRLINPVKGSDIIAAGHLGQTTANRDGSLEIVSEFELSVIDDLENPVSGATIFIEDVDNGNRRDRTEGVTVDYTTDRDIIGTTNAGGIYSGSKLIAANISNNYINVTMDRRTSSNNISDEDVFRIYSYNHLLTSVTASLKGSGVKSISRQIFTDPSITESTKATVDAYTTIDNLDQLYDRAKSWKVDNVGLEYPAIFSQLIDGNGTELDLGDRNLVIDASASSAFTVNTGTKNITIKSTTLTVGSKFSTIKTTGTITLQNGATLETGYIDTTGTYVYMELTNLDQQNLLVTDQQNPSAPVTILSLANQSGIYKTHFALPTGGEIKVLVERDDYAPWTETIPNGDLNFIREVNTSLSPITGANQIITIDLLIKLLQKTEAVLNSVNVQALPVPAVNVTTNTTSSTGPPSVDNQNVEIAILSRILAKLTAIRDAVKQP